MASQCPNKRTMYLKENGDYVSGSNASDEDQMPPLKDASDVDEGIEYPAHGGRLLVARRALSVQVKEEDDVEMQWENIFHTRCLV